MHVAGKTTILRDIPFDATVDDVCRAWAVLRGEAGLVGRVEASTLKGRALQGCQVISRALGPNPELCLAVTSQQVEKQNDHNGAAEDEEDVSLKVSSVANDESATSAGDHTPDTYKCRTSTSPLIGPLLERAADKEASQHYKSAAFIYDQVRAQVLCSVALSWCFTFSWLRKLMPFASYFSKPLWRMTP